MWVCVCMYDSFFVEWVLANRGRFPNGIEQICKGMVRTSAERYNFQASIEYIKKTGN